MSTGNDDPLEELVVDRRQISKERAVEALNDVVNITEDGSLLKGPGLQPLNSKERIVALLLAQWAAAELGFADTPTLSYGDLAEEIGLSTSATKRYLDELVLVQPSKHRGGYRIPEERLVEAADYVESGADTL
jgi:hypothetical protein